MNLCYPIFSVTIELIFQILSDMQGSRKFHQAVLKTFFSHQRFSQRTSLEKQLDPRGPMASQFGVHASISKETYNRLWFPGGREPLSSPLDSQCLGYSPSGLVTNLLFLFLVCRQKTSMTRKCHNHRPQTYPRHFKKTTVNSDSHNRTKLKQPAFFSSAIWLLKYKGLQEPPHKTRTPAQSTTKWSISKHWINNRITSLEQIEANVTGVMRWGRGRRVPDIFHRPNLHSRFWSC